MNYILRADVFSSTIEEQNRLLGEVKNKIPNIVYKKGDGCAVFFSMPVDGNSARYETKIRALARGALCYVYYEPCLN